MACELPKDPINDTFASVLEQFKHAYNFHDNPPSKAALVECREQGVEDLKAQLKTKDQETASLKYTIEYYKNLAAFHKNTYDALVATLEGE